MQTILRSETLEVKIRTDGPFVVIGEKINPTGRKKLAEALQAGDFEYVRDLAKRQVEAGADVLDLNVGVPGLDEVDLLPQIVSVVAATVKAPICIDSPNPSALAAALRVAPGKPLVNSVNGEEKSLATILPIVKDRGAAVIALTMDDNGIPTTAEDRCAIAARIIERAVSIGIPIEDVVIDPLVMSVGADQNAGAITLRTIELVREEFGANINLGASNVSFGLPDRHILNQAFLALAIGAGATCAITDPMKLTATIRAADLLRGRDLYAKRYISYCRAHPKESAP
jgi:5-methyltetrahydrofolate--homocysteine methyltransferase